MNREDFESNLRKKNISHDRYSLYEGLKSDAYILDYHNASWNVIYMDERGNQEILKYFLIEADALSFIYNSLLQDYGYIPLDLN